MRFLMILLSTIWIATGAKTLHYKVSSPFTGTVGKINLKVTENGGRYKIEGDGRATGLAKSLTKKRKDRYISIGRVKNGRYVTDRFIMEKRDKKKLEIVKYIFDYKKRKITKHKQRWKHGKIVKDQKKVLKYFASTDLLSLFHNMLLDLKVGQRKDYLTVGAEKLKGRVTVELPDESRAKRERKNLEVSKDAKIVYVSSREKIDGKSNRKAVFAVDKNGDIQRAYIKGIPVVGKIYLKKR